MTDTAGRVRKLFADAARAVFAGAGAAIGEADYMPSIDAQIARMDPAELERIAALPQHEVDAMLMGLCQNVRDARAGHAPLPPAPPTESAPFN